ncbi:hypothetical protein ACFL4R_01140 [Nitrospirota bacterium]
MKRFFIIVIMLLVSLPATSMALDMSGYQPPAPFGVFSTASAETPEPMQSAVSFTFEKVGKPDFKRYSTQLAMGLTRSIEFGINIPYVDDSIDEGIEDITFSIKHRFFDEGKYGPSAAYILTGSKSSNNEQYSTGGGYGGGLIASKRLGPVQVLINALYSNPKQEGLEEDIRGSLGFIFAADHNFNLLADIMVRKSYYSRSLDQAEARIGYRFLYGNRVYSTLGVALGIDDKGPDYRILLSVSLLFPKKKMSVEALD